MKSWVPFFAVLAMAGCVHFTPKPLSPEDTAGRFDQRSLGDASLQSYVRTTLHRDFEVWPPVEWDLESLTLAAFYFNPDLEVARSNYDSAAAGMTTAAQRPNPSLSVSPAYNATTAIPSPWLVTATLDVPLETAGKRGYRRAMAGHVAQSARFALATAAWDVRARLRQTLLELWAAERSGALLKAQLAAQQEIVGLLEAELKAGGIAPAAVSRERITAEQTRLLALDAQSRHLEARTRLATVIGVPAAALENIRISFTSFEEAPAPIPSAQIRRQALLNRSDILGALADYAAAESALQLEIARQYPDIHLNPGYEFDQGSDKWGVGLSLELPVLNRNRGPIAEAQARRKAAAAKFNALQARVIGELESALAGLRSAQQKLAATTEILSQSRSQEQVTNEKAKAGEVGRQALAAARLETLTIELSELDARLKAQQAAAALENAMQVPIELVASVPSVPKPTNTPP